jgi:hypothetical protein
MVGKAGEHAVAAQLLVRGVHILFPASDYGVDIQAENGCRIQVKSAHLVCTEKALAVRGEGTYSFVLRRRKRMAVSDTRNIMRDLPPLSESCDVLALWGIEQNRFWIVPSTVADKTQLLCLGREQPRRFVGSVDDVREMVKLGYKHHEIAKKYNVGRELITMLLNRDGFESQDMTATQVARQCENAWENITNFRVAAALAVNQDQGVS